jgi:hypothetical protein
MKFPKFQAVYRSMRPGYGKAWRGPHRRATEKPSEGRDRHLLAAALRIAAAAPLQIALAAKLSKMLAF